jgi:hypothetical protein
VLKQLLQDSSEELSGEPGAVHRLAPLGSGHADTEYLARARKVR